MPPRKRQQKEVVKSDDSDAEEQRKSRKTATKRTAKQQKTDPEEVDNGWTLHWPNLIYKKGASEGSAKIAAFDFDGTLVNQKSTARVPKDAEDWKFFNKKVAGKLKEFKAEGFKLVIFTNQGGIKSKLDGAAGKKVMGRVDNVIDAVGEDFQVLVAPQDDDFRKPKDGMWKFMVESLNDGVEVDKEQSFFVGDMAGRPMDLEQSDSDKKFALNVGVTFKVPETVFGEREGKMQIAAGGSSGDNHNPKLSKLFNDLARMGEAEGDNRFAITAYRKVAGVMAGYPHKITLDNYKELKNVAGVGKNSIEKIGTFLTEGGLPRLDEWLEAQGETKDEVADEKKLEENVQMASKFL